MSTLKVNLRQWLRLSRLVPLITVLGAAAAVLLSLLGVYKTTTAESILIALLTLLAVDALVERVSVLERLEAKLGGLPFGDPLKSRRTIPPVQDQAQYASEICIAAVSAISLNRYAGSLRRK